MIVAASEVTRGEAFNCASGVKVTIKQLADAVLAYFGKSHLGIEYREWNQGAHAC